MPRGRPRKTKLESSGGAGNATRKTEEGKPEFPDNGAQHSPSYYLDRQRTFNKHLDTVKLYRSSTNRLLGLVERYWMRYFKFTDQTKQEALEALEVFPIEIVATFFEWLLDRPDVHIGTRSALQTYYNALTLFRYQRTGQTPDDGAFKRIMDGFRQRLVQSKNLRTGSKDKPIMDVDNQYELLCTILTSPDMNFERERDRVATLLATQLIGNTASRPDAVFKIQYRDVRVAVMRDPELNNEEVLVIHSTFGETKTYLGEKNENTIPLLSHRKERCLLLCLHITILGMAFGDSAFQNEDLDPLSIYRLKVLPFQNELNVPWKVSILDELIFGTLTVDAFRKRLKKAGEILGIEVPVNPYAGRRGDAKAFDKSDHISVAMRNQLMQHGSSLVFDKNYQSNHIAVDVGAAYRNHAPQMKLVQAATGLVATKDSRRPWKLSPEQAEFIQRHPEVEKYNDAIDKYRKWIEADLGGIRQIAKDPTKEVIVKEYQGLKRDRQAEIKAQEVILLRSVKEKFTKEQPYIDIDRQMKGLPAAAPNAPSTPTAKKLTPQLTIVVSLLLCYLEDNMLPIDVERQFRAKAVAAVRDLCGMRNPRQGPSVRWVPHAPLGPEAAPALGVASASSLNMQICLPL